MHQLTGKQELFLNQVGEGKNIYLTGKASPVVSPLWQNKIRPAM